MSSHRKIASWLLFLAVLASGIWIAEKQLQPSTNAISQSVQGPALRNIRVRLDWTPWAPHAALYAALQQGYFKQAGLNVTLYVPPDPEATTQLVAAGRDDFGISYMTDTILAREQGLKVVSIAALIPHPLNSIMTAKSSGIDTPSKLAGKTIGTTGVPSDQAYLNWVLQRAKVNPASVRLVNIGFDLAPALKSGKVDAIIGAYWPWEGIKMTQENFPINVMKLQDYGVPDYYELVLISREDLLRRDPVMVRAFLGAMVRGQEFVQQHPDQAVEILHGVSPDLDTKFLSASLQKILPLMQFPDGTFQQNPAKWQEMSNFMRSAGLLKNPPETSTLFTNRFLK